MTKGFNPNRTVSLSKISFFKLLHLLIRSYQVPVLLICPLALSHFLKFKVFIKLRAYNHESKQEAQIDITSSPIYYFSSYKAYPCIRLAGLKFELTNQDSAGGKNFTVLA